MKKLLSLMLVLGMLLSAGSALAETVALSMGITGRPSNAPRNG